jgi:hypothetical protein
MLCDPQAALDAQLIGFVKARLPNKKSAEHLSRTYA